MTFDIYQTAAIGVAALIAGGLIKDRVRLLRRICIPSPVIGGLCVSLLTLLIYGIWNVETTFDSTIKDICMIVFFTTVGYQSNLSLIRKGGRPLGIMVLLLFILIILQNLTGVGIANALGEKNLLGMAAGSISMCGGHGTAGGFAGLLEDMGLNGADSIAMAAATFGLIAGSLLGGPLSGSIIRRNGLKCPTVEQMSEVTGIAGGTDKAREEEVITAVEDALKPSSETILSTRKSSVALNTEAVFAILISMGIGTLVNIGLKSLGISFPTYFGSLLVAAAIRNISETKWFKGRGGFVLPMDNITDIGSIALKIFLGIAMISLKLWELASLALPLILILLAQALLIWAFARFLAFPLMGRNYDSAVMVGGICGFGLGAIPNAMANMEAVCERHGHTALPFLVVPLVGAVFVDILNVLVTTVFLNFL